MAGLLGRAQDVQDRGLRPRQEEVLHPRHVPVPVWRRPPCRPSRRLHGDGHLRPLPAQPRLQRPAPHGMGRLRPPRRAVRDRHGHAPRDHDEEEHRQLPPPDPVARLQLRLGPRGRDDRPVLLQVDAVDLQEALREGPRLRCRSAGELVPGPWHRPRQRGGHQWPLRARQPPRRAPPDAPVDAEDHGLRGASARRPRGAGLARRRQGDAAQLDRQVHRRRGHLRHNGAAPRSPSPQRWATKSWSTPPAATRSSARPTW